MVLNYGWDGFVTLPWLPTQPRYRGDYVTYGRDVIFARKTTVLHAPIILLMLLSDIFENFREVCMKNYKLDPAWYYTSPGLSWDALLKYTKIELDLLSDIDTVLFVEQGIRGGVSMISNRFSEANNKYMESYDDTKESTLVVYMYRVRESSCTTK